MKKSTLTALLVLLRLAPAPARAIAEEALVLDGVRAIADPATTQVVTVNRTRGHRARVSYWRLVLSAFGTHPARDAGGFRWWLPASNVNASERLADYRRPYEWSIVTGLNLEQVRHRGSGIFLHVNGRGATAGCVSAPCRFLRLLVRRLDPAAVPVIAIGR